MATKTRQTSSSANPASSDSPPDATTAYAREVVAGRIIAGPHVRAACARHLRDLEEAPARGLSWRPDLAERVFRYFRVVLRLTFDERGPVPFVLEPWQRFLVGSLFGWLGADGYRRFRIAFVETAKGSGKSPLAAGIGLYMLHADGEPRAQVYAAAAEKEQAFILFRDAVNMVEHSPALAAHLVTSGQNPEVTNLAHLKSNSFFRPVASKKKGQSGPKPHCALLDEIHEHPNDVVVEMMRAGFKGRRQPLLFMITNAGVDRQSVCFRYHEYAAKVAEGVIQDDAFFAYVCAVDENEDPLTDAIDPELGYPRSWAKANPSIGVTLQPKYLEEQVHEARGMPAKESFVRRVNFGQWVDAVNPWISGELWRACEVEELPTEDGSDFLALDLSGKNDLTAAARARPLSDGRLLAELRFWTPADSLAERERRDRVPYSAWVKSGHLIAVPGRTIDYGFVVKDVHEWLTSSDSLAFDPWRIDLFQKALDDAGIDNWIWDPPNTESGSGIRLVRHGQGFLGGKVEVDPKTGEQLPRKTLWMPGSISRLEDLVTKGHLLVLKNPVLTHASASAVIARDAAGNGMWEKRKSTGRIDGIVALSMAAGLSALAPVSSGNDVEFW